MVTTRARQQGARFAPSPTSTAVLGHSLDKWNFKGGRAGKRFLEMPQGLVDENQRIVCRRGVIQIAGQTQGLRFQQYRFEHQRDETRTVTVYVVPLCEVVSVRARTDSY